MMPLLTLITALVHGEGMHDQLTTVYDDLPADRVQDQTHTINVRKDHTQIKGGANQASNAAELVASTDLVKDRAHTINVRKDHTQIKDGANQASNAAELIGDALRESAKRSSGRKLQGTKKSFSNKKSSSKCFNTKKKSSSVLKNTATLSNAGRVEEHPKVCSNLWTPTFEEKGWEKRCEDSGKVCPSAVGCGDHSKCSLCYNATHKKALGGFNGWSLSSNEEWRCAQCANCGGPMGQCNGPRNPLYPEAATAPTKGRANAKLFASPGSCTMAPWPEYGSFPVLRCRGKASAGTYQCVKAGTVTQELFFKFTGNLPSKKGKIDNAYHKKSNPDGVKCGAGKYEDCDYGTIGWVTASAIKWVECVGIGKLPYAGFRCAAKKNGQCDNVCFMVKSTMNDGHSAKDGQKVCKDYGGYLTNLGISDAIHGNAVACCFEGCEMHKDLAAKLGKVKDRDAKWAAQLISMF